MIETVIQQVLSTTPPSYGDNLLGFAIDLEYSLGSHQSFLNTSVAKSSNPHCLLEIVGDIAPTVVDLQEISSTLTTLWQGLMYKDFQATAIQWRRSATVFRFVTAIISHEPLCVTGKITIGGEYYSQLVEKFDRNFGSLLQLKT